MARTQAGAALTQQHYRGQLAIRARALQDYSRLWPLWEGDAKSYGRLVQASIPLLHVHHQLSSAFTAAYFEAFRKAERVGGTATAKPSLGLNVEKATAALWVTGENMTQRAIAAGFSPQAAMQTALVRTSGSISRLALMGGRDSIVLSTAADKQARGWERITSGNACDFCELIASNGAIFSEDTADFEAHDHCSCTGEPAY